MRQFLVCALLCVGAALKAQAPATEMVVYQNYAPSGACVLPQMLVHTTINPGEGLYQCYNGAWQRFAFLTDLPSGVFTAGGDLSGTSSVQRVIGLNSVPFCMGFTPTNSQVLQYTTNSFPVPCYTAVSNGGGSMTWPSTAGYALYSGSNSWSPAHLTDDGIILTSTEPVTAPSYSTNGTTPAAQSFIAGSGNIPALAANSAGFAAPVTGGVV